MGSCCWCCVARLSSDMQHNSSSSSGSSSNSSSDDGYKTEVGEASLPSPFTEPVQTSTSSSREIIEGLERELEWLQQTLEEAEREWQEVSKCGASCALMVVGS